MKKPFLIILVATILVLTVFLLIPKKENVIVESCEIKSSLQYAKAYMMACRALGLKNDCTLAEDQEVLVQKYRKELLDECVAIALLKQDTSSIQE